MMQEAMIICPRGNGIATAQAIENLIDVFGGCTVGEGQGFWKDPAGKLIAEPVETLTVAMTASALNEETLRGVAERYGNAAQQIAVYIRHASGAVEFLSTTQPQQQAA